MSKAINRVMSLRHMSETEARAFCAAVQSHFKMLPPFDAIADIAEKHPQATAEELGKMLLLAWKPSNKKTKRGRFGTISANIQRLNGQQGRGQCTKAST